MSNKITQNELEFNLIEPINVSNTKTGMLEPASDLILAAPKGGNQFTLSVLVKKYIINAMNWHQKNSAGNQDSSQDDLDIPAEQYFSMVLMTDIDIEKFLETFKGLMLSGCCKVVALGNKTITSNMYDGIDASDLERLIGEYIKTFVMRSLLANAT